MNRDRLRRRARPPTSCAVVQKSSSSSGGALGVSASTVTDHGVHRSLSLPAVVRLPTTVILQLSCCLVVQSNLVSSPPLVHHQIVARGEVAS